MPDTNAIDLDLGSLPAWMAAIVGSISATVAATTYVGAERRRRRSAARRVIVSFEAREPLRGETGLRYVVRAQNLGTDPVLKVSLFMHAYGEAAFDFVDRVGANNQDIAGETLEAGKSTEFLTHQMVVKAMTYQEEKYPLAYATATFVDVDGYSWAKYSFGQLLSNHQGANIGRWYRVRKKYIPAPIRHFFRDRARKWRSRHMLARDVNYRLIGEADSAK